MKGTGDALSIIEATGGTTRIGSGQLLHTSEHPSSREVAVGDGVGDALSLGDEMSGTTAMAATTTCAFVGSRTRKAG